MSRIVYLSFPNGSVNGGQKMILRHVETLRDLGFEAICWHGKTNVMPTAFAHEAPIEVGTGFRDDDVLVVPSDAPNAIRTLAAMPQRSMIFCQSQFSLAGMGFEAVDAYPAPPVLIAVGPTVAAFLRRAVPGAPVEIIPAFADERVFRPLPLRRPGIACSIQKRRPEAVAIEILLKRFHPTHADLPWTRLSGQPETEVAQVFGSSTLMLSLSRLEALGITPLEAMASGCLVAGFTGIGGQDYATAENGIWVPEDDCVAAADALAEAADLAQTGGPALRARLDAGFETARTWSYAAFRPLLEAFWMRQAPEARRRSRPV